jgi:hypothetical protein
MIVGKLCPIPSLEFFPFGWIVVEPATQIAARRYVPASSVHLHRLLFHPSWPQTFHKETRAILFRKRVKYTRLIWIADICNSEGGTICSFDA